VPVRIKIGVEGAEEVQRFLELAPEAQQRALEGALLDTTDALFAFSQEEVPVDKGTLKKSGTSEAVGLRGEVGYNTTYAIPVHEGSGLYGARGSKYPIVPVNAKALAFPPSGARSVFRGGRRKGLFEFGGRSAVVELVFRKSVMHPGVKPNPWMRRALVRVQAFVPEFVLRRLREEFEKAGLRT